MSGEDAFCRILKLSASPPASPSAPSMKTQPAPARHTSYSKTNGSASSLSSQPSHEKSSSTNQMNYKSKIDFSNIGADYVPPKPGMVGRKLTDINVENSLFKSTDSNAKVRPEALETPEQFQKRCQFFQNKLKKSSPESITHYKVSDIHDGKDPLFRVAPGEKFNPSAEYWEDDGIGYHPRCKTDIHIGPSSGKRLDQRRQGPFSRYTTDVHTFGTVQGPVIPRPTLMGTDPPKSYPRQRTDLHKEPESFDSLFNYNKKAYNRKVDSDIHPVPQCRRQPLVNPNGDYARKNTDIHLGEGEGNLLIHPDYIANEHIARVETDIHMDFRGSAWSPEPTRRVLIAGSSDSVKDGLLRGGPHVTTKFRPKDYGRKYSDLHVDKEF